MTAPHISRNVAFYKYTPPLAAGGDAALLRRQQRLVEAAQGARPARSTVGGRVWGTVGRGGGTSRQRVPRVKRHKLRRSRARPDFHQRHDESPDARKNNPKNLFSFQSKQGLRS